MIKSHLRTLKNSLQRGDPKKLEYLAADLITRLIGVKFAVAKAGFQHGSDAATVGRAGRHLRIECKRYQDERPLSDRELQGEIDDAIKHDKALEAWILVATRPVSQQTADALRYKAVEKGVPTIIIDWPGASGELPTLAALCASAPDLVGKHYGRSGEAAAKALAPHAKAVIQRLERELTPWAIGYELLLAKARERFNNLWVNANQSRSLLGQDIAGGRVPIIARQAVSSGLTSWWLSDPANSAVVNGLEGMGKTWAVVHWVQQHLNELPVFLILPSSVFKQLRSVTPTSVVEFLGDALYELFPGSDRSYWQARVSRLLLRPADEGPALFLLVDGINQEPSVPWERFLQLLEADEFSGRVRIVVTTQTYFLREHLNNLVRLSKMGAPLEIGPYDLSKGGEFDQLLAFNGVKREDLTDGVIELARVPRMFALTMKLKADEAFQGAPTPERLLWAYARDQLGQRANSELSESDWLTWLQALARRYLDEISAGQGFRDANGFSKLELGDMARDPTGSPDVSSRRLQEIVSGAWLEQVPGRPERLRPRQSTIQLALGVALVGSLTQAEVNGPDEAAQALDGFLDPVRATSIAADILSSALSAVAGSPDAGSSVVPRLILAALLQSQNATDKQRQLAVDLAPALVQPLLHVVEDANTRAAASARYWALAALRSISELNVAAWTTIVDKIVEWVCHVDAPSPGKLAAKNEYAQHRAEILRRSIGTSALGVRHVLGAPLRLHDEEQGNLADHVPELLLGKPLTPAVKVFVAAAVASAVSHTGKPWMGLKWLVMFNRVDRNELQATLDWLSTRATLVDLEPGINAKLARKIGNLLLWLTADEALERKANRRHVSSPQDLTYREHYLADPMKSMFVLEHRHVGAVLASIDASVFAKLDRIREFLPDPALKLPSNLSEGINEWGEALNVEDMASGRNYTVADRTLEEFIALTSRASPEAMRHLIDRWLGTFAGRQDERRHWAGTRVPEFALLISPTQANTIRAMRLRRPTNPHTDERAALMRMLQGEILHEDVDSQLDALVNEPQAFISIHLAEALRPPAHDTIDNFVHRWGLENSRALEVLCNYLCMITERLSTETFARLVRHAMTPGAEHQTLAFMALSRSNPEDFGQELLRAGWQAVPSASEYLQDSGSTAVLSASKTRPLEELANIVAPWCLLDEAMRRGASAADVGVAARAIDTTLRWDGLDTFPATTDISVSSIGPRHFVAFAVADRPASPEETFRNFDPDARWAQFQAASRNGEDYLRDTKSAGAVLASRVVDVEAARALVRHCRDVVDRWLDGVASETPQTIARLNAAGGLFLALCEALFEVDAAQASLLWRALRRRLRIRFQGIGEVNELLLMVFRVPESTEALALRKELFSLPENEDDASYLDLALAALSQGAAAWLASEIAADAASSEPFRQRRAIVLRSFIPPDASYKCVWEYGEAEGTWDALRRRSQQTVNRASQARYWWRAFLTAGDQLSAFCAWRVFLSCADKMTWVWLESDLETYPASDELWRLKMLHYHYNTSEMTSAIKEKIKKGSKSLDGNLVNWDVPRNWFSTATLECLGY